MSKSNEKEVKLSPTREKLLKSLDKMPIEVLEKVYAILNK